MNRRALFKRVAAVAAVVTMAPTTETVQAAPTERLYTELEARKASQVAQVNAEAMGYARGLRAGTLTISDTTIIGGTIRTNVPITLGSNVTITGSTVIYEPSSVSSGNVALAGLLTSMENHDLIAREDKA